MNSNTLNKLAEADDIVIQLGQFKMGLMSQATGGDMDIKEYERQRKMILSIPEIDKIIPSFLKLCRTPSEFWSWIKGEASTYQERRQIIAAAINPILEVVEYETGPASFEFKKNYEEIAIIGQGGYGLVYKYQHRLLNLPFAVKIFAPAFHHGGEKELERFFQESRMLFNLDHKSIIKIYDAGLIGPRPFIRMEYFDGKNLNQILNEHGLVPPEKALTMMQALTSGMEHAHSKGIIHRDLKPSNIMAAPPNQFRIIDFGLGIFVENDLHSRLTKVGESTVSGYYNAPELVENPQLIDIRSDIYSLGAIWYTALTGQPPAGSDIISRLKDVSGITNAYIECLAGSLAGINSRTASCSLLLEQIEQLRL
jgi:serine/threonine protein kinase